MIARIFIALMIAWAALTVLQALAASGVHAPSPPAGSSVGARNHSGIEPIDVFGFRKGRDR